MYSMIHYLKVPRRTQSTIKDFDSVFQGFWFKIALWEYVYV